MAGKSVRAGFRTLGSVLGVGGLAALVALSTAACGSTSTTTSGATGSPVTVATSGGPASPAPGAGSTAPSAAPSAPASGGSTGGGETVAPVSGPVITPQAQLTAVPAGRKLTPFESATRNSAGTILYLGLLSQGGACGQYDVVVQQSASSVSVGLVLLPSGGRICPMYVGHMLVEAKLSTPLGSRSVVDLATDQPVRVALS